MGQRERPTGTLGTSWLQTTGSWSVFKQVGGDSTNMSVATVTEISAVSDTSFEDAIQQGIARATKTLRNVEGAWVKDQNVMIEDGNIKGYKVNLEVTFVLEE